jgi:anthranilate synthase/aminodeoxychorismate synthase-like glutamine amidotransferase
VLVVDNYDSFTWNLVGLLAARGAEVQVLRHDARGLLAAARRAAGVVISPGPGRPAEAGQSAAVVELALAQGTPLLGVCLGHQLLAEVLGGRVVRARQPMHGKVSPIALSPDPLWAGLGRRQRVMRYHSLVVAPSGLPRELRVIATSAEGAAREIMAVALTTAPAWGVQFHPESILSPGGAQLVQNWLDCLPQLPRP